MKAGKEGTFTFRFYGFVRHVSFPDLIHAYKLGARCCAEARLLFIVHSLIAIRPKMTKASYLGAVCLMVALLLAGEAQVSMSVVCNAMDLSPCAGAIFSSAPPTKACCVKLSQQKPCLCKYLKDPNLRKYITSANAKRVSDACKIPFPKC